MKRKTKKILAASAFVLLILGLAYTILLNIQLRSTITSYANAYDQLQSLSGIGDIGSAHEHANFAVFVNGKQIDFTRPDFVMRHSLVHIDAGENNEGVAHKHATGITYGMFFKTIDILLAQCLTINGKSLCDTNDRTVKYYLNGKITLGLANAEIRDMDKVLVSYGAEAPAEIQAQLADIEKNACVQSKKC